MSPTPETNPQTFHFRNLHPQHAHPGSGQKPVVFTLPNKLSRKARSPKIIRGSSQPTEKCVDEARPRLYPFLKKRVPIQMPATSPRSPKMALPSPPARRSRVVGRPGDEGAPRLPASGLLQKRDLASFYYPRDVETPQPDQVWPMEEESHTESHTAKIGREVPQLNLLK